MKVLSLLQPWASLVVMGHKTIETRRWTTGYRGKLLIHASSGKAGSILTQEPSVKKHINDFSLLPFGAIIGEVILADVIRLEDLSIDDNKLQRKAIEFGAFGAERKKYGWIFEDAVAYRKPIPAKGHLHLWDYPDELYEEDGDYRGW